VIESLDFNKKFHILYVLYIVKFLKIFSLQRAWYSSTFLSSLPSYLG
jgi:hypothetical protein